MFRNNSIQTLGEAIENFLQTMKIQKKMQEIAILKSWENVVGKKLNSYTKNLSIQNGILYISTDSSLVRNELMLNKEIIIKLLNEKVNAKILFDIIVR